MIYYHVLGLTFRADCELPLDRIRETSVVDYSLRFDYDSDLFEALRLELHCPFYVSSRRVKCGRTVVEVYKTEDCRKFLFRFYDGIEFLIDRRRKNIWIGGLRNKSRQAAINHLLFSLTGFLLGLRKSACLHGAAIGWGNSAIALLGGPYFGKSVLAANTATRGIEVLSDDLIALDVIGGALQVYPGYPWICMRPKALQWRWVGNFDASRFRSRDSYLDEAYITWDLRRIGMFSQTKPKKLETIYLLAPIEDSKCTGAVEQVPRHEALIALMEAASRTHIPYLEFRSQEFSLMGSIVATVPTYRLRYHLSAEGLAALSCFLAESLGVVRPRYRAKVEI